MTHKQSGIPFMDIQIRSVNKLGHNVPKDILK